MQILEKANLEDIDNWYSSAIEEGGLALIDKPKTWTSFDVVNKLRRVARIRKTGHAGTLDPLATGLLILCFGKATKQSNDYQGLNKTYWTEIKIGAKTKSFDAETEEEDICDFSHITTEQIEEAVRFYMGTFEQIPPIYSAKSVNGVRLYNHARNNREIVIAPSLVTINSIGSIETDFPYVRFSVECSKGTYIRSLASDIGNKIGVGAYLSNLRRTAIENFSVDRALTIDEFVNAIQIMHNSASLIQENN